MRFIKVPFDNFERKYNKDHREDIYKAQQDAKALEACVKVIEKEDDPNTSAIATMSLAQNPFRRCSTS